MCVHCVVEHFVKVNEKNQNGIDKFIEIFLLPSILISYLHSRWMASVKCEQLKRANITSKEESYERKRNLNFGHEIVSYTLWSWWRLFWPRPKTRKRCPLTLWHSLWLLLACLHRSRKTKRNKERIHLQWHPLIIFCQLIIKSHKNRTDIYQAGIIRSK